MRSTLTALAAECHGVFVLGGYLLCAGLDCNLFCASELRKVSVSLAVACPGLEATIQYAARRHIQTGLQQQAGTKFANSVASLSISDAFRVNKVRILPVIRMLVYYGKVCLQ